MNELTLLDGSVVTFKMPAPGTSTSCYFFSMERSGSSMLWDLAKDILVAANRPFCEPLEDLFDQGVAHNQVELESLRAAISVDGYVFGMIRHPEGIITHPFVSGRPKLIFVRDPRDVIVSLYHSLFSHRRTGGGVDAEFESLRARAGSNVSDFALTEVATSLLDRYTHYAKYVTSDPDALLLRYEDYIYRKRDLVHVVAEFLGIDLPRAKLTAIAEAYDKFPAAEDSSSNIRSVLPGNYIDHLREESCVFIEETFAHVMLTFGYVPEACVPAAFSERSSGLLARLARERRAQFASLHQLSADIAQMRTPSGGRPD